MLAPSSLWFMLSRTFQISYLIIWDNTFWIQSVSKASSVLANVSSVGCKQHPRAFCTSTGFTKQCHEPAKRKEKMIHLSSCDSFHMIHSFSHVIYWHLTHLLLNVNLFVWVVYFHLICFWWFVYLFFSHIIQFLLFIFTCDSFWLIHSFSHVIFSPVKFVWLFFSRQEINI